MNNILKPLIFAISILIIVGLGYVGVTQVMQLRSEKNILESQKMDYEQTIEALKSEAESLRDQLNNKK